MDNVEESRRDRRYSIADYLEKEFHNVYIEIMMDKPIKASVSDISMNGLGFEISSPDKDDQEKIDEASKFHIKVYLGREAILIEGKKTWGALIESSGSSLYKGGFMFSMVSPEDRLHLLKFLDHVKKGSEGSG